MLILQETDKEADQARALVLGQAKMVLLLDSVLALGKL
jgi:hypothetical protein